MYAAGSAKDRTAVSGEQHKVAILMGTYNGERFLKEQLDSIAAQSHTNWELYVSDDGSTDNTLTILNTATTSWPNQKITVLEGPHKGFVANFLSLACNPHIEADYYAFSDQDDVWEKNKLNSAIGWLKTVPADKPAMYCSRTRLIDEQGNTIGFSPLFKRKPSFKNALVQSIAGANTMVFNHSARSLLTKGGYETPIVSHDWWIYMLVTGYCGRVFYDLKPSIAYRQHTHNLVGSNMGWNARQRRIAASLRGRFIHWNDINLSALLKQKSDLSEENRNILRNFCELRNAPLLKRCRGIATSGLYRQTKFGNISLFIAALLGKI